MRNRPCQTFVIIIACLNLIDPEPVLTSRILALYPTGAESIITFHMRMVEILIQSGHDVTVVSGFPAGFRDLNYSNIDVSNGRPNSVDSISVNDAIEGTFDTLTSIYRNQTAFCERLYSDERLLERVKLSTFDLVVAELSYSFCLLPLAFSWDAPVVGVATGIVMSAELNGYANPANVPTMFSGFAPPMNFLARLENTFNYVLHLLFRIKYLAAAEEMAKKNGVRTFSRAGKGLVERISLYFVNTHSSFIPRAMAPNEIEIGGIHIDENVPPLPKDVQKFVEKSNGVIFVSFGSVLRTSSLSNKHRRIFENALSSLPYRVLWRHEKLQTFERSENILLAEWLLQTSVLALPKTKLFISHCGIMSVYEAIHFSVPLLCVPIDYDQFTNTAIVKSHGVGGSISFRDIIRNESLLTSTIERNLNNVELQNNMKKLREKFKDRPLTAAESFAFWINYVLRQKNVDHLRPMGNELPLYQFLLLDIVLFVSCIFTFITCVLRTVTQITV